MEEPHRDPEPLGGRSKFELFEPVHPKARKPKQKVHQLETIPEQEEVEETEEPEAQAHSQVNSHSLLVVMSATNRTA